MSLQASLFPPEVEWRPPLLSDLPSNWNRSSQLSIDVETCDIDLRRLGPGVRRGAYICGVAFALDKSRGWYLPIRHTGGDNLDPTQVLNYVRDQAAHFEGEVVGAKLDYDLDFLAEEGAEFKVARAIKDTLVAEPLLDELQLTYGLDDVLKRHDLPLKDESLLLRAIAEFGLDVKRPKRDLHKLPGRYVGAYGERDVTAPLELLEKQEARLSAEGLDRVWALEQAVTPVLIRMRRRGVRVDFDQLDRMERFAIAEETKAWGEVHRLTGVFIRTGDAMKPEVLIPALLAAGITPDRTPTGKPSITKGWLENLDHPVGLLIRRARKMSQLRTTFVNSIREHAVNGRVHCTFNQIVRQKDEGEEGTEGAAYGRLSAVDPNLQQQPARDPEIGPAWRKVYIPDEGTEWCQADYSQQEPKLAVHFAVAAGISGLTGIGPDAHKSALEAARRYHEDPSTDAHLMFTQMVHGDAVIHEDKASLKLKRDRNKSIYLGICYGEGGLKLCRDLGLPTEVRERNGRVIEVAGREGQALLDLVDERVPYVRATAKAAEREARKNGYVRTVMGRKCRFPRDRFGNYDWTHKAFNRRIQGSAADQTKIALVLLDRAGIPLQLQVHDEVDFPATDRAQANLAKQIMEECLPLHVPSKVDIGLGPSWGEVTED